ncbi:MAG: arylamine N-acetyltransferase [Holophagaceae bacterium]
MSLDLEAYLRRTGYAGPRDASLGTLKGLHAAHATAIPFENLAIQLGELPLRLDEESLQAKLVACRRGGYCFEQNHLFQAVLRALGFEVRAFEARVRMGSPEPLPRTHMLLGVTVDGRDWLCDVGFGGEGLFHPVAMDGEASAQPQGRYRVAAEGPLRVLQSEAPAGWMDLYAFEPVPRLKVDFELGNWFTSTHPDSRFVKTLTAQLLLPDGRRVLRGVDYTVVRGGEVVHRVLEVAEIPSVLREDFGLEVPDGAVFRAFSGG